jgi:hypothetical protein
MVTCSVARIASDAIAKHLMSVMVGLNWRHFVGFAVAIAFGYYGVYNHWPIKRICITLSVILVSLKLSNLLSFRSYRPIIVAFVGCWLFVASLLITQPPLPYQLSSSVISHQQVSAQKCLSLLSRDVRWTTQNGKVTGIPSRLAATSCHSCLRHKQHAFFGVRSLFVGDSVRNFLQKVVLRFNVCSSSVCRTRSKRGICSVTPWQQSQWKPTAIRTRVRWMAFPHYVATCELRRTLVTGTFFSRSREPGL